MDPSTPQEAVTEGITSKPNGKSPKAPSAKGKTRGPGRRAVGNNSAGPKAAGRGDQDRRSRTYPTVKEPLELDHDIIKGAFKNNFDRFRSAFFHVTSVLGRFNLEDEATRVHGYIVQMIESAETEIKTATGALSKQIERSVGNGEVPRTSNNREVREAEIPAYVVRRYVGLFKAADRLIDAIVYAETTGAISWQRRGEMLRDVPRYLRTPAGRFHSIASKLHERQKLAETNVEDAKDAMSKAIQALLETQMTLKAVEDKRPLVKPEAKKKPATKQKE